MTDLVDAAHAIMRNFMNGLTGRTEKVQSSYTASAPRVRSLRSSGERVEMLMLATLAVLMSAATGGIGYCAYEVVSSPQDWHCRSGEGASCIPVVDKGGNWMMAQLSPEGRFVSELPEGTRYPVFEKGNMIFQQPISSEATDEENRARMLKPDMLVPLLTPDGNIGVASALQGHDTNGVEPNILIPVLAMDGTMGIALVPQSHDTAAVITVDGKIGIPLATQSHDASWSAGLDLAHVRIIARGADVSNPENIVESVHNSMK